MVEVGLGDRLGVLFPGQGAQVVGMGRGVFDASIASRGVFEEADDALAALGAGVSVSKLCFEGPESQLQLTAFTQPAVLTVSVAVWRALQEWRAGGDLPPFVPVAMAGHSLGEYSALVCAGSLGLSDAVKLVHQRGKFMQEAVPVGEGAMVAVVGLEANVVVEICARVDGPVSPANFNAPTQTVVAGAKGLVEQVVGLVHGAGGKALALPVSAPFHCPLMEPAAHRLAPLLDGVDFQDPTVPVVSNVDAALVTTADQARDALKRQVTQPVRWVEGMAHMVSQGVNRMVEVGPGNVLTRLMRRIDRGVPCVAVSGPEAFTNV